MELRKSRYGIIIYTALLNWRKRLAQFMTNSVCIGDDDYDDDNNDDDRMS